MYFIIIRLIAENFDRAALCLKWYLQSQKRSFQLYLNQTQKDVFKGEIITLLTVYPNTYIESFQILMLIHTVCLEKTIECSEKREEASLQMGRQR